LLKASSNGVTPNNRGKQNYRPIGSGIEPERDDVGYTGHKFDTDTGLIYAQARYYDPVLGRFYSKDPIGSKDQFNVYAYVGNNPMGRTDPTGKFTCSSNGNGTSDCTSSNLLDAAAMHAYVAVNNAVVAVVSGVKQMLNEGSGGGESAGGGTQAVSSPDINPGEVSGQTPEKIHEIAIEKGLIPKGPNPQGGQGSYTDPVTGKQRILVHPDAACGPHCHVNDKEGNRLDENGNNVPPESPEAHLPLDI
jgi:RHS repeat-associated protein